MSVLILDDRGVAPAYVIERVDGGQIRVRNQFTSSEVYVSPLISGDLERSVQVAMLELYRIDAAWLKLRKQERDSARDSQ